VIDYVRSQRGQESGCVGATLEHGEAGVSSRKTGHTMYCGASIDLARWMRMVVSLNRMHNDAR
jgi:hypothetical protein